MTKKIARKYKTASKNKTVKPPLLADELPES
jgi:hypothetical protein